MKKIFLILALGAMVVSCTPNNNGEGGADAFMHPAYFALDDITVVKE